MDTTQPKRGRQVQPELDAKVGIAAALELVLGCSAIEAARLIAQADPEILQQALQAVPIDADRVLEAISRGAYAMQRAQLESEQNTARKSAARAFPTPASGVVSPGTKQRRSGRVRVLLGEMSEHARNTHPRALDIERDALAIIQGQKNRRSRGADNSELVAAIERALVITGNELGPAIPTVSNRDDGPWTIG